MFLEPLTLLAAPTMDLEELPKKTRDKYNPVVIDTVLRHFYVDDMLRALKNEDIAIRVAHY